MIALASGVVVGPGTRYRNVRRRERARIARTLHVKREESLPLFWRLQLNAIAATPLGTSAPTYAACGCRRRPERFDVEYEDRRHAEGYSARRRSRSGVPPDWPYRSSVPERGACRFTLGFAVGACDSRRGLRSGFPRRQARSPARAARAELHSRRGGATCHRVKPTAPSVPGWLSMAAAAALERGDRRVLISR